MAYRWMRDLRAFAYPPTCVLCEARGHDDLDLCADCADELPRLGYTCARCALPVASPDVLVCGACQQRPPAFDKAMALYHYQPPVSYLIHQLKFHGRLLHARLLGHLLAEHLSASARPECIVPVPLHPRRIRGRGFNQAVELARHIGRRLRVPVDARCVRRNRHTDPQMELPAKARRKNIRGAFEIAAGFNARHVAILDDVITTGATAHELARVLRRAGAERIEVWSIARVA
ncbi:MAG: double zinc ribbon domain-containing protein [Gammaproteobacteria bacterium]